MKALSMLAMAAIAHATPEMNKLPNGDTKVCMFWRAGVGFGGAGERVGIPFVCARGADRVFRGPPLFLVQIKHFVVLLMENRPIDHTFGCMAGEGVIDLEGINGTHSFPADPNNETAGTETVTCGTANYVCEHGPGYSMWELKVKPGTQDDVDKYPYGEQDDKYSALNGAKGNAIM